MKSVQENGILFSMGAILILTACSNKQPAAETPTQKAEQTIIDKPDSFLYVDPKTMTDKIAIVKRKIDTVVTVNPVTLKNDTEIISRGPSQLYENAFNKVKQEQEKNKKNDFCKKCFF